MKSPWRNRLMGILAVLALSGRALAGAGCGDTILNVASVTLWSGPIDQIGYTLSYNVSATVKVICPITAVVKYAIPRQVSAGGLVTFYICIDNQRMSADGSVWNLTVTDKIPAGMTMDVASMLAYNYGTGAMVAADTAWSTAVGGPWTSGAPPAGQGNLNYVRWRIPTIGTIKSGCVAYRATIQ